MARGKGREGEGEERCFGGRKKISIADLLSDEVDDETKSKVREVVCFDYHFYYYCYFIL